MSQPASQPAHPSQDPRRRTLMQIAVNAWGTAVVLDARSSKYSQRLKFTGYIGFILPVVVGAYVAAFGVKGNLDVFLFLVSAGLVMQTITSATLVYFGYEEKLSAALNSSATNKLLAAEADELAKNVSLPEATFSSLFSHLQGRNQAQETVDERLGFTLKDRRIAARAGMKRFNVKCNGCGQIPKSADAKADSSTCNDCGDF